MPALWVCFAPPDSAPGDGDVLLSIMPPLEEDALQARFPGRLLRSREVSLPVRRQALRRYVGAVARLGLADAGDGRSLRAALAEDGATSLWWYHPTSFRDCEAEPAFEWIIHALTIEKAARQSGAERLVLWGAPEELEACLRAGFKVEARRRRKAPAWPAVWLHAALSRLRGLVQILASLGPAKSAPKPAGPVDAALSGFWDWSVLAEGGRLSDRYFKRLPDELEKRGLRRCWLAWYDPGGQPGKGRRGSAEVLAPLLGRRDVALLQRYLRATDVLARFLDFSPLRAWLRARRAPGTLAALRDGPFDFLPLLERRLLRGFADAAIPRFRLVELAAARAFAELRPRVSLNFLEHNLHSRAIYAGARRGGACARRVAVQHCSYAHQKSFIFYDGPSELRDGGGFNVPRPDSVFCMGELGREIFLESGYTAAEAPLLGSTRYDHVRPGLTLPAASGEKRRPRLLIVSSLDVDVEIEMVEAACAAAEGLDLEVALRDHPFSRIAAHPRFARWAPRVTATDATLEQDLARADAVLFTYSTVAEEALLAGRAVWHWRPRSWDASALVETTEVPSFSRVARLRVALQALARGQVAAPSEAVKALVLRRLFSPADGRAAERAAEAVEAMAKAAPTELAA